MLLEARPRKIPKSDLGKAATIGGAERFGTALEPGALPHIDLIVAGSVAVSRRGTRLGKGGGYSDLEYAISWEVGSVDEETVATTVHPLQLLEEDLPETAHDFRLDLIVTPGEVIRPKGRRRQPAGILPAHLTEELRRSVSILQRLGF